MSQLHGRVFSVELLKIYTDGSAGILGDDRVTCVTEATETPRFDFRAPADTVVPVPLPWICIHDIFLRKVSASRCRAETLRRKTYTRWLWG